MMEKFEQPVQAEGEPTEGRQSKLEQASRRSAEELREVFASADSAVGTELEPDRA